MKERWNCKKEKFRKRKKKHNEVIEFILEMLFWLPELIILPFRLIFWLIRGIGRWMTDVF
ncbi:hypothetical protein [Bacillus benzoevorans]|uniref:Uncharacterized protein n=1 Tax=Bacillus benzoevorans TaxID=1456 RepID=A0A7X0HQT4_9BACI|nr:hypothetical protein [Bacillus benzoevorans]MBB6444047.1 hypothetical protein [Bacillus benzoevorans]